MVPAALKPGRSFKGAAKYYFHDKGAESDERVEWVEIVNLPTADHDKAWRMMAHTALAQDELKKAAGVKATGRKLDAPVFTYSLSWHPSETPTREEMTRAAMETLKVLGLEEHQAVIVCHNDEPHAHVHLIVNRVHPETGRAATLSRSHRKLSEWALKYEQSRGQVFAKQRLENAKLRADGIQTYNPRVSRPEFELKAANENLTAEFIRKDWKRRAALLYRQHEAAHDALSVKLRDLKVAYDTKSKQIYREAQAAEKEHHDFIKTKFRLNWKHMFQDQYRARGKFERRERSALGKIWNMAVTAQELRSGRKRERIAVRDNAEGNAFGVVLAILKRSERLVALERRLLRQRKELGRRQWDLINQGVTRIREDRRKESAALKQAYLANVDALRREEAQLERTIRNEWKAYRKERDGVFRTIADRKGRYQAIKAQTLGQYTGIQRQRDKRRDPKDDDR